MHHRHLEKLFKMARAESIKFKLSKCQFMKKQIKYLGHQIEHNTIRLLLPHQYNSSSLTDFKNSSKFRLKRNFWNRIFKAFIPG